MIEYLMGSLVLAILGIAVVAVVLRAGLTRARDRKELARKRHEIASQDDLEQFIRRVDRVTTDEELNHLGNEEGNP
jgi:hypothetical protein